ncbi:hypothetical protein [Novosphingobium sp. HII-3]|uniref:hypothetical protein n=1 Tax=Novosphingobium sp. HII-3 TaxID=2075565 RepID=UPI0018EB09D2|nr:hypothetical protein [Novosphingobium sp. HII-3]
MTYTVEIGAAPINEECAQLGQTDDFATINRLEVRLYRAAIIARYGVPPEGVTLRAKANAHDFGTYRELVAEISDAAKDDPVAADYLTRVEDGLSSWLSAGFAPPIVYGPGRTADLAGRTYEDIVRGAMMTTRPGPDGSFFPPDNETLHHNLRAGFPDLVPDGLEAAASRYVVVENAGYVGERDVHQDADRQAAETWMERTYTAAEIQTLHVAVAHDHAGHRTYELL